MTCAHFFPTFRTNAHSTRRIKPATTACRGNHGRAGPYPGRRGTGKTRAITFRMANLIANGVPAESILAVTFTNKAAEEMRNRVSSLLLRAGVPPAQPWLSTFHSLCARLLRREAAAAGLPRDFAIYDDDDQLAAVKLAMAKLQIDDDSLTPRNILSRISHAKNHGQTSGQLRAEAFDQNGRHIADIFAAYERLL